MKGACKVCQSGKKSGLSKRKPGCLQIWILSVSDMNVFLMFWGGAALIFTNYNSFSSHSEEVCYTGGVSLFRFQTIYHVSYQNIFELCFSVVSIFSC